VSEPLDERPLAGEAWLRAPASRRVVAALLAGGRPARFVGGCVRDSLIGRADATAEIDIATPEPPERVIELLEAAGIKAVPTGIAHGTVTAVTDHRPFEITTLRRDVSTDGRRAVVAYTDDFTLDAQRRDFTMNAMSADPEGRLFDPFDGRADLQAGRVRFVGEARARILEDHLRILRFFRFHARYGQGEPDPEALAACAEGARLLRKLSGERLHAELLKLLAAPDPLPALRAMAATGVLAELLGPEVALDRLERLLPFEPARDPILRLAALLRPPPAAAQEAARVAQRLRFSNRERERLQALVTLPLPEPGAEEKAIRARIYATGNALHADLLRLALAEWPEKASALLPALALAEWRPPMLPVGGADVLAQGVRPGRAVGRHLAALEAWWIGEDFAPDRAACLARLEELIGAAEAQSSRKPKPGGDRK
jgi:poly(A) polymerase